MVSRERVEAVADGLGVPGILVNNAGTIRDNLLAKMSAGDGDQVMGVHLRGAFLKARATQAHTSEQGWGRIVTMSSASGLGNRGHAAAKAGLRGFTRTPIGTPDDVAAVVSFFAGEESGQVLYVAGGPRG